jgi:hypothetical protein
VSSFNPPRIPAGFLHALCYRTKAPWGLGRISSQTKLVNQDVTSLTFSYDYDTSAGANSDVYIIGAYIE